MPGQVLAGAAALALLSFTACGGRAGAPPSPAPPGPDVGVAGVRPSLPLGPVPSLGQGVDALRAETRDFCLVGPEVTRDLPVRVVRRLAQPFSQAEVADLLGTGDAALRARRYLSNSLREEATAQIGDPRSVTLLYGVEVRTGTSRLDVGSATLAPTVPAPGTAAFTVRCGDLVAVEKELGVQAFLLYRFSFATAGARATFDHLVGVDAPLWELRARLAAAEPALGGVYAVSSAAAQYGGDVRALAQALPYGADAAEAFVAYVTGDGPGSLEAQAHASPGAVGWTFDPWSAVTSAPAPRAGPAEVVAARAFLAARVDDRAQVRDRIDTLRSFGASLAAAEAAVAQDLVVLEHALVGCYDLAGVDDAAAVAACTAGASAEGLAAAGYTGAPALSDL